MIFMCVKAVCVEKTRTGQMNKCSFNQLCDYNLIRFDFFFNFFWFLIKNENWDVIIFWMIENMMESSIVHSKSHFVDKPDKRWNQMLDQRKRKKFDTINWIVRQILNV